MEPTTDALNLATLETVNRVARAAHAWIRHKRTVSQFLPVPATAEAGAELAAGVIAGLCDVLLLDAQHALLSAYAFALLEGEDESALETARALLAQQKSLVQASAYSDGKSVALEIISAVQFAAPANA
jgi:hypothetical protein